MDYIGHIGSISDNQQVNRSTGQNRTTEPSGEFDELMRAMISPDEENKISEEALFAALIRERLVALKDAAAGDSYASRLDEAKTHLMRGDGFVSLEEAAVSALQGMRDDGEITDEEYETIYSQAFSAAQ